MFHRAPGLDRRLVGSLARVARATGCRGAWAAVRRTTLHLEVVRVMPEQNLLLLRGAVPGATGGLLLVRKSVKLTKAQQHAAKKA